MKTSFIVGIDLGTTNCAVAYLNTANTDENIHIFEVPQLVSEGGFSKLPLLPSYLYLAGQHEVLQENIQLPWDETISYVVGEFGKQLGARVPARLVSSAKSWLCHTGVDRKAAILPWGASKELQKLSPIEASSRYLQHIRDAWNYQIAEGRDQDKLENQEVILTVPASFDEVARELTLEAAQKVGLNQITLLEEPQAAFYCWIANNGNNWHKYLHNGQIVLICDIGGGTSDFSLITVQESGGKPLFTRLAVGDHLILGGDNIDMALARQIEVSLFSEPGKLDSGQWATLTHNCRMAKEELLSKESKEDSWPIIIQEKSSRLIGSTLKYELTKEEMLKVIEEGFFPITDLEEEPQKASRAGIQEWGLPYTHDTAISRHLSSFLRKHQEDMREDQQKRGQHVSDFIMPDAVLFNGGALKPPFFQKRITQAMENWTTLANTSLPKNQSPLVLSNDSADLAVAYGAAYYGLVRKGRGIRIKGGIGRSYYIGVATEQKGPAAQQALCVIPRKMEEEQEVEIKDKEFSLLIGEPVSFPVFSSSTRLLDQAGDLLSVDEESFTVLPPIQTILRRGRAKLREVPVHIKARLTAIGTIELWCVSRQKDRQWKLQFGVREGKPGPKDTVVEQEAATEDEVLEAGRVGPLFKAVFDGNVQELSTEFKEVAPENLLKMIEKALQTQRQNWPVFTLRQMSEMLLACITQRGQSVRHEARWFHLTGFCLRPGFGYNMDDWRVKKVWKIFHQGLSFPKDRETRIQWWIMWRRLSGGLNQNRQTEIFQKIAPYLLPQKKKPTGPSPSVHELAEMWRLAASLERLPEKEKEELGGVLLNRLTKNAKSSDLWALARLGARQPFYGGLHTVVSLEVVEDWLEQLLALQTLPKEEKLFTLSQLSKRTPDRSRNVGEEVRQKVIDYLLKEKKDLESRSSKKYELHMINQTIEGIEKITPFQTKEQALLFGESLPKGLHLKS